MRQMRQMRRHPLTYGASLALSALLLLIMGCSPTPVEHPRKTAPQIFREALPAASDPAHFILDPAAASDTGSLTAIGLLFDGLVTLDGDMTVRLWGASNVDISPDGRTYTFHLRPGQFFSDGAPVHASDYAFAINRALSPCTGASVSYSLFSIASAQTFYSENCDHGSITPRFGQAGPVLTTLLGSSLIPDDGANTLTIRLQQPSAYFLTALATPSADALEASVFSAATPSDQWTSALNQGATGQGGSGMYYIRSWVPKGAHLTLAPNPHWWGLRAGMAPKLSEIDLTLYPPDAPTAAYTDYQAGSTDATFISPLTLQDVLRDPDYHQTPQLSLSYLLLNWRIPPFDNLDARIAFCLAVNRAAINQQVYGGAMLPTWHLVPQGMPGYNPHLTGPDGVTDPTGDAARAQAHWHAYLATLHGKAPAPVTYSYYAGSISERTLASVLQQQWRDRLNLNDPIAPWTIGADNFERQATFFRWTDFPDPHQFLSLLFATGAEGNASHASVPAADALLQRADAASNAAQRLALYNQAEQLLINQVALCPLEQDIAYYKAHSWVRGWFLDPQGLTPDDAWRNITIAAH